MKFLTILIAASLLLFSCDSTSEYFEGAICIENINTIDPESGLSENQTVIVKDGKILKIAPTESLKLNPQNQIIDGTGKYMIPGLWDSHVHFAFQEELAPRMFDLFLAYGVTSVRDTGGEINFVKSWKEKSLQNPTDAPRVMIAGPLLDGTPNVYDGSDPFHPPLSVGLSSVEDVEHQVNFLDSMGVDFLKAYEMLTPEQFRTITRMAEEKGMMVDGHVPLSMDAVAAAEAGLNSMEHFRNLEMSMAGNWEELLTQRLTLLEEGFQMKGSQLRFSIHQAQRESAINNPDPNRENQVFTTLAKYNVRQTPTLALMQGFAYRQFKNPEWQQAFEYLPEAIENQWKSEISEIGEAPPFLEEYANWLLKTAGKVHEANIEIMAGTDCPIFYLTPGRSLHQELSYLVEAGLTPLEAIRSATVVPSEYFGLDKELGNIKEGMWADLVILNANPMDDIRHTENIEAVIKQGKLFSRQELDTILINRNKS